EHLSPKAHSLATSEPVSQPGLLRVPRDLAPVKRTRKQRDRASPYFAKLRAARTPPESCCRSGADLVSDLTAPVRRPASQKPSAVDPSGRFHSSQRKRSGSLTLRI